MSLTQLYYENRTLLLSANDMEDLYHSNLYINVATMLNDREIGGRIVSKLLGPAQELADHPILIAGESNRFETGPWLDQGSIVRLF